MYQDYLENILKHRLLGPTPSFWFSKSGVEPNNLHFRFPDDSDTPGLGTLPRELLLYNNKNEETVVKMNLRVI